MKTIVQQWIVTYYAVKRIYLIFAISFNSLSQSVKTLKGLKVLHTTTIDCEFDSSVENIKR